MRGIARGFFLTGVVYGSLGLLLGLHMGLTHDHGQLPTHAHIMVIGWVSFAVFGFFYFLFGDRAPKLLGLVHFWLAQISLACLVVGLWLLYSGETQFEPLLGIASLAYAGSFLLFAYIAFVATRSA